MQMASWAHFCRQPLFLTNHSARAHLMKSYEVRRCPPSQSPRGWCGCDSLSLIILFEDSDMQVWSINKFTWIARAAAAEGSSVACVDARRAISEGQRNSGLSARWLVKLSKHLFTSLATLIQVGEVQAYIEASCASAVWLIEAGHKLSPNYCTLRQMLITIL